MAPNVFFRSRPTRLDPEVAVARLADVVAAAFPLAGLVVALDDGRHPVVAWQDGPSGGAVADVVAEVVNWEVRTPTAATAGTGPTVVLDRSFSDAALAVAVIRHQASHVRPYASTDPAAVASLSSLLESEDPARSGYPVVDAMAALLLTAPEPEGLADRRPADRWAAKLSALGYDELWKVAWSALR